MVMAAPEPPTPILDHIVILVPHATLLDLPPWLTDAFTVLPGGRHADGVTENKLILFRDGVYLELIAFLPGQDDGRASHHWGRRREGHVVDWADSLPLRAGDGAVDELEVIRRRVGAAHSGIEYGGPKPGGRVRPDGEELAWVISSPYVVDDEDESPGRGLRGGFVGGEAPFWCLDRTPRDLRVPYQVEDNVRHACGAVGCAGVSVWVRDEDLFGTLRKTYDALQGHEGIEKKVDGAAGAFTWGLQVPGGQHVQQRTLTLALASNTEKSESSASPDVYVELSLVSSSREGEVSGHLGDEKWLVKFDLQKQ